MMWHVAIGMESRKLVATQRAESRHYTAIRHSRAARASKPAAAGDIEQQTGAVGGLVGAQPQHRLRHLLGACRRAASARDPCTCRRGRRSPKSFWMSVSIRPGRTALTRMPSLASSLARPMVRRVDGALGGGVVGRLVAAAELGGHRRHVDDDAAVAAEPRRHAAHGLLRGDEGADGVDGQDALQPLRRDVDELGGLARRCRRC